MLVRDLVTAARLILQDTVDPFRYSNDDLVRVCNQCLRHILVRRPDLALGLGDYQADDFYPTGLDDPVPVPDIWLRAVPQGMAALGELIDNETASDGRAAGLWELFESSLK